ncbi:uncharacterized protein C8Q71DRAFT_763387 [Rhodofomes roseus]|uniref:SAGA-associated factor 11 n=1 Tax=Rhodofomes roseus TaxID=34475 RepID=A0ABQ8KDS8_9APHY|nr:uncharacterized protein C8Q71DRAFT_763387 [Rhodofomes roseus]KAH9835777.1 hypothetical protein C8Q71DRAFT_763387 [Rhodofomes roseus]
MGKKERDEVLSDIAGRIFAAMVDDALMDVVLESHQSIARSRKVCDICHTYCEQVHVPGASGSAPGASPYKGATPTEEVRTNSPAGTGTNTPVNGKSNGNVILECVNCGRQMASNRYAAHLADCMGLSTRRGATRNASHKAKIGSDAGRSASPFLGTEDGMLSDDGKAGPAGKGKGKSRAKRVDDAEFNLHRKRPGSPIVSPKKNAKKAKTSGSPMARVKEADGSPSNTLPVPGTGSHSRVPSKLRDSSIVSTAQRELSSSPEAPSRVPSPAPSMSTLASAPSLQSPTLSAKTPQRANGRKGKPIHPPPQRRPSPPRPPPPPVIRMPEPDYLVDVDGDETGSSTDTDSD